MFAALFWGAPVYADNTTYTIGSATGGDVHYATLEAMRTAVGTLQNGDIVILGEDDSSLTAELSGASDATVTFQGSGTIKPATPTTATQFYNNPATLKIEGNLTLDGFKTSDDGGAIYNDGTLTLSDGAEFNGNTAGYDGGAIYNEGTLTLSGGAEFSDNTAVERGGAIGNAGELTLSGGVEFSGNEAEQGGAIANNGTLTLSDYADFNGNTAVQGGAIGNRGELTLSGNADFDTNTAQFGGAIYNDGTDSTVTFSGSDVSNVSFTDNGDINNTSSGGAIYNNAGTVIFGGDTDVSFTGNKATLGGAIYSFGGEVAISGSAVFTENIAGNSGGAISVMNEGTLVLTNTSFIKNEAKFNGGAIDLSNAALELYVIGDQTAVFSGNTHNNDDTPVANSIYVRAGADITIAIDDDATLDMRDPLANNGEQFDRKLNITKNGGGIWKLGGTNDLAHSTTPDTPGIVNFTVNDGTLHLYREGEVANATSSDLDAEVEAAKLYLGSNGAFTLGEDAVLSVGGGNLISASTITIGNGSTLSGTGALTLTGTQKLNGNLNVAVATTTDNLTLNSAFADGSGAGSLTKIGTGTLTLSGANTYTGTTTINAGGLTVTGALGAGGNYGGAITNSGALTFNQTAAQTLSGVISGDGALTKLGTGTLTLSGANIYTGATTISAGGLTVTGTLGAGGDYSGTITNSGALTFNQTAVQTLSGEISGAGALTKLGAGTLTLSGTNTYSGATTISAGGLTITGALGTGGNYGGAIANAGTLTFNQASAQTLSGVISGTGNLVKSGAGALTLAGNVEQNNITVDTGATLNIAANKTAFATGTFAVGNGATLGIGIGSPLPVISADAFSIGTGATLAITGYTSGSPTIISSNSVITGDFANFTNDGTAPNLADYLTLNVQKIDDNKLQIAGVLAWNRAVDAHGTFNIATDFELNTSLLNVGVSGGTFGWDGTTMTKNGAGVLTLTGTNANTKDLTVNAGTLSIASDDNLGQIAGAVNTLNNGATLQLTGANYTKGWTLGAGTGTINNAAAATLSGVLSGSGALTKSGAGILTLSGANTYTGSTTISAGKIIAQNAAALSTGAVANNAALDLNFNDTFGNVLSGNGALGINGDVAINHANTFSGATTVAAAKTLTLGIQNALQNSAVVLNNGSILNVQNQNTTLASLAASGGATINLGARTLSATSFALTGANTVGIDLSAAGEYTLLDSATTTDSYANVAISNLQSARGAAKTDAGDLKYKIITGPANLIWNGTTSANTWNTETGNKNWQDTGYAFSFINDDNVTFDNTAENKTVNVAAGGVTVGTMAVNDDYNFTGGVITAGAVTVAAGKSLGLDISAHHPALSAASVDFNTTGKLNITGYTPVETENPFDGSANLVTAISTTGGVTNFNPLVTVANQANADFLSASAYLDGNDVKVETRLSWYSTDPTRQAHGNFEIADEQTFTLGAALADNTGDNRATDWDGKSLTKTGTGTLTLTGINTYTGATNFNGGAVALSGAGSLASTEFNFNGGLLTGGVSSLTGAKTYNFALDLYPTLANTDNAIITATAVNLDGAIAATFGLSGGDGEYTLFSDISGTADKDAVATLLTRNGAARTYTGLLGADDKMLKVTAKTNHQEIIDDALADSSANAGIGAVISEMMSDGTLAAQLPTVFAALDAITDDAELGAAITQLNGANSTSNSAALANHAVIQDQAAYGEFVGENATAQAAIGQLGGQSSSERASLGGKGTGATGNAGDSGLTGFAKVYGGFGANKSTHAATGYDFGGVGAITGVGYKFSRELEVGALIGYSYNHSDLYRNLGKATDNVIRLGAYGNYQWNNFYFNTAPTFGIHLQNTERNISIINQTAKADRTGFDFSWYNRIGYTFALPQSFFITPSYALGMSYLHNPAYTEYGAEPALKVDAHDSWSLVQNLELRLGKLFQINDRFAILPEIWGGWEHEYLSANDVTMRFAAAENTPWSAPVTRPDADRAVFGAGITTLISDKYEVFGRYNQRLWDGGHSSTFTVGLGVKF